GRKNRVFLFCALRLWHSPPQRATIEEKQNGPAGPRQKGSYPMRIAVTYANGEIFQHFGRTEQFKVYDVADGKVTHSEVVGTNGQGHGALAGVLQQLHADVLVCGGIGGGAQAA